MNSLHDSNENVNVASLQRQLEAQKRTINALQNENHWLQEVIFNPTFNEVDMRLMVETTPREIRMGLLSLPDAPEQKIYYPVLAEKVKCSEKVASQHVRKLDKAGALAYRTEKDPESGNTRAYIQPLPPIETPSKVQIERAKRGGSTWKDGERMRRCHDCGSTHLTKVTQKFIVCDTCGTQQTAILTICEPVNDPNSHIDTNPNPEPEPEDHPADTNSHIDTNPEISKLPPMCINTGSVDMEQSVCPPKPPKCHYDGLPPIFLRNARIWCCGRFKWNEEKQRWDKKPYIADMRGTAGASSTVPSTWRTFEQALAIFEKSQTWTEENSPPFDFLVFMCDGQFVFLDQDHCFDRETGTFTAESLERARRIDSYTEESISGDGIHTYAIAKLPPGRRRNDAMGIEMYDSARPCVYTGKVVPDFPTELERRQEEIAALHTEIFPPQPEMLWSLPDGDGEEKSDEEIELLLVDVMQRISKAKNGEKIMRLWNGDYSDYKHRDGTPDHSAGDAALCHMLAFYVGKDVSTVDKLFRHSKMYRPKWDRADYRERTFRYAFGLREDAA